MRRDFYDRGREETVAGAAPIGGSAGTGSGQGTKDANAQAHSGAVSYTHLDVYKRQVLLDEQVIQHFFLFITEGEKELGEKAVSCQLVQLVGAGEEDVEKVSLTELTEPWQIHPEGSNCLLYTSRCV